MCVKTVAVSADRCACKLGLAFFHFELINNDEFILICDLSAESCIESLLLGVELCALCMHPSQLNLKLYSMGLHSSIYPVCPESANVIDKGVSSQAERGCNIHKEEKDTAVGRVEPRRARLKNSSFARIFSASTCIFPELIFCPPG